MLSTGKLHRNNCHPDITSAVYHGHKAINQTNKISSYQLFQSLGMIIYVIMNFIMFNVVGHISFIVHTAPKNTLNRTNFLVNQPFNICLKLSYSI